jgi:REP element-mobilizing transposase RayT
MKEDAYRLDSYRRAIVLKAIKQVCGRRNWTLLAAHVRTTHVHVVVSFDDSAPEAVMNAMKSKASRLLNEAGADCHRRRRWTRHGSTVPVRNSVEKAISYVVDGQGRPMDLYIDCLERS